MFNCPRCGQEYPSYNSLSKHTRVAYKLSGEMLYREYHGIKEIPTCKCGCGTPTKWRIDRGYGEYIGGHNSRTSNPMSGKTHSENAKQNISQKRKEKFANGEYEIWQYKKGKQYEAARKRIGERSRKENNPARARKISNALKGKARTHEHQQKLNASIKKTWQSVELKEKQRENILNRFFEKKQNNPTALEITFGNLLEVLKLKHQFQYIVDNRTYDFYLNDFNILIEVDGDFHHCNPKKYKEPIYESQLVTIKNDALKNQIAKDHGFTLLRFWETDINERPFWVIQQLFTYINHCNLTI
jgi:very-short-patch-repair endonuclease